MDYSIKQNSGGINIKARVQANQQQQFLEELQKCAQGQCTCPSPQYEKLQSIEISHDATGVSVDLKAKAGQNIDEADIARCLEHTATQLKGS